LIHFVDFDINLIIFLKILMWDRFIKFKYEGPEDKENLPGNVLTKNSYICTSFKMNI